MINILLIIIAPLMMGWMRQVHAWMNNASGAGILQPYRDLRKLFNKEPIIPDSASIVFTLMPYVYFVLMCVVASLIPVFDLQFDFNKIGDLIVLIGVLSLARLIMALAAMDVGTAFGTLGARREMFISFLVEPALLMVIMNVAMLSHSISLSHIVTHFNGQALGVNPSLLFAGGAFIMVLLAENARFPIDNPNTHLELTMIHEAMLLEYSGRYLALMEWGTYLKLINYFALGIAMFFPWGIEQPLYISIPIFISKIIFLGAVLTAYEVISAKIRIFRAPEFLSIALTMAILGVIIQLLMME